MRELNLKNNIKTCIQQNKNTPRIALTLNFSIINPEKYAGEYSLMNRLLLQGTTNYSAEELATILDENAIELYTEMKYDYLRFHFVSLNEDFEKSLELLADIVKNTTFNDFEKERIKFKGELSAELDSAKIKVSDLFTKNIYKNHYYGGSFTKVLEEIDNVTVDDVRTSYNNILNNSYKTMSIVGDLDENFAEKLLNKYLSDIPESKNIQSNILTPQVITSDAVELIKDDAQQAQIIQGWLVPTLGSLDYEKIMLLNIILGASGLSSRLFLELREKKGLAYTVRTSYETHAKSGVFSIYIGTEPSNIKTSIEGFKVEIEKIKNELVSDAVYNRNQFSTSKINGLLRDFR
ncbi:MAG: insulinase family protein [bacterium]|nr:insulinase family protein [bacterium]